MDGSDVRLEGLSVLADPPSAALEYVFQLTFYEALVLTARTVWSSSMVSPATLDVPGHTMAKCLKRVKRRSRPVGTAASISLSVAASFVSNPR